MTSQPRPVVFYRRDPRASWRVGPGEIVVFRRNRAGFELTGTPALLWVVLDVDRSMAELRDDLSPFGPPNDLESCLGELVSIGLVTTTERPGQ